MKTRILYQKKYLLAFAIELLLALWAYYATYNWTFKGGSLRSLTTFFLTMFVAACIVVNSVLIVWERKLNQHIQGVLVGLWQLVAIPLMIIFSYGATLVLEILKNLTFR